LAFRYHALPVAEDEGHITVAMADPYDDVARDAIITALGSPSCVVSCSGAAIDTLLSQIWSAECSDKKQFLVYTEASRISETLQAYSQYLGQLSTAEISLANPTGWHDTETLNQLVQQDGYDLIIWEDPRQTTNQGLPSRAAYGKIAKVDGSVLLVRDSRWPIRQMLLVVRGEESDSMAVDWVVRLARPSCARVTVLTIVSPVPAMYGGLARMQQSLDALLKTNTALGQQMRHIARQLVDHDIEAVLRLRQGTQDGQICCEISSNEYDMIIVAGRQYNQAKRWLLGERISSLLRIGGQPILIAKEL
jgi:nucleotide-binding universal stress UspA family protein